MVNFKDRKRYISQFVIILNPWYYIFSQVILYDPIFYFS